MKTADEMHRTIWLQPHAGEEGSHTWCADQINDDDIAYVRADLLRDPMFVRLNMLRGGIARPSDLAWTSRGDAEASRQYATFEDWLGETEAFSLRAERVPEGTDEAWLRAAFEAGRAS